MTGKEEIQAYLAVKEDKRDYTEGFNLFCRYSRAQAVQRYLSRKTDREKLFYKLQQLLEQPEVVERKIPSIAPIVRALEPVKVDEAADRLKSVSKGSVKREDLPEELQPLYDEVSEAYKKMRSVHEKMKIAKNEKSRAGLRKDLVTIEDFVREGWAIIDNYVLTGEMPKKEEKSEVTAKDVTAARTYLSRGLKSLDSVPEEKKPELVEKLKARYEILVAAKNEFDPKTIEILTKYGIIESGEVSG